MRYSLTIDIDLPVERVITLFNNTENLQRWQPDLVRFEHQSGEPGQAGAKSLMVYKMGKSEVEMVEEILVNDLPEMFSGTYTAKGVWNRVENRFEALPGDQTRWHFSSEFKFSGLMMRIMGALMPGMFRKQSLKYLNQFKDFAESA